MPEEFQFPLGFEVAMASMATVTEGDPKSVGQALSSPEASRWRDAMDNEIKTFLKHETFKFEEDQSTSVDAKWVFKVKKNNTGGALRY